MRINRVKMLSRERAADRAERQALKTAMLELTDAVTALQEHVIAKQGLVAVEPQPAVVTPGQAREIAADLVHDAEVAEKKP